jgi:iron complex transport system permease protein
MQQRATLIVAALLALACASLVLAGTIGSVPVPLSDLPAALLDGLQGKGTSLASTLVDLRLTRALVAFVTGAALALAGVLMQALLRNPLADPYVLGSGVILSSCGGHDMINTPLILLDESANAGSGPSGIEW